MKIDTIWKPTWRRFLYHGKSRLVFCFVMMLSLMLSHLVFALEPPRPGEIEQLKQSGKFDERLERARALGNDRIDKNLLDQAIYKARRQALIQDGVSSWIADMILPAPPPSRKLMPTKGSVKMFALLIDFPDYPAVPDVGDRYSSREEFHSALFGDGSLIPSNSFPYESLKNYYQRASYNQLDFSPGMTLGWYRAGYTRASMGTSPTTAQREQLIKEAIDYFKTQDPTLDFSQFNNDASDDKIELFYVFWTGPNTGWSSFWWAYQTGWGDSSYTVDGCKLGKYVWQWAGDYGALVPFEPYVAVHETGHGLGLPDYYDYDGDVGPDGGIGSLDMMDGNWGDHNSFSKWVLEWITPTMVTSGSQTITLDPSGTSQDAVLIMPNATSSDAFQEFFIVQNRYRVGNDPAVSTPGHAQYPTDGMLVWHVDARLNAAGTNYAYDNSYTDHKLLKLMEADGNERIERFEATVNAAMYYQPGNLFGPQTTPNSRDYQGVDSGVNVTGISQSGQQMTATFSIDSPRIFPTLTVTKAGNGSGAVASVPSGIDCGSDCQESYTSGTSVTLTATPSPGSSFSGWSGGGCSGTGTCTVNLSAATTVTATFSTTSVLEQYFSDCALPDEWEIVRTYSSGYWWISSSSNNTGGTGCRALGAGVSGGSAPYDVELQTPVMDLSAYDSVGLEFKTYVSSSAPNANVDVSYDGGASWTTTAWSKPGSGFTGAQTVNVDLTAAAGQSSVMLRFRTWGDYIRWEIDDVKVMASGQTYTLSYTAGPGGTLTGDTSQTVSSGGDGTPVTAVPDSGYDFVNWSDSSTDNPRTDTNVTADISVTANFLASTSSVTSAVVPSDPTPSIGEQINVEIGIDMSEVASPHDSLGSFTGSLTWNTAVLEYVGNSGVSSGFTGYVNDSNVASGTIDFNGANANGATGNITVLSITFDVVGAGSSVLDLGYSAMAAATTYSDLLPLLTVTDGQVNVPPQYTLTMAVDPVGSGTVDPAVGDHIYDEGTVVDVTATPETGWHFVSWTGGVADPNAATTTVTVDGNKIITANFAQNEYTLTTSVVGSGSITRDNAGPYHYGDVVELTAVAAIGWTFDSWSGDLNGSTTPATITIDGNKNVSATFTQNEYTLTTSVVGSGSITRDNAGPYHYGDVVELTAVAAIGWTFDSWSGDLNGSTTPATITIDGNKNVSATFTQNEYTLTTSVVGSGSITRDNAGPYHYGDVVELTAVAAIGWTFDSWSGDLNGSTTPATITIDGNKNVSATFTQNEYTLTTSVVGSGSITRDNAGPYHYGDVVELTAVAAIGWTFDSWSGDLNGSTTPATITIDGNKNVSATFTQNEYTLTTSVVGSGSITRDNAGPYHYGDVVELTAVAAIGWTFDSWSGDLNGSTTPATITIDGNKNVSATFTQNEYTLTTSVVGSGSITRDNAGPYHYGDVVELTAVAAIGWTFDSWSGDLNGSTTPATITIDGNKNVSATFTQNEYTLTTSVVGSGSITRDNAGPYHYGDVVELTAVAAIGWTFDSWSGDLNGSTTPATITIDGNKNVSAAFTQNEYTLTTSVVGSGSITRDNAGPYHYGDVVELTAVAAIGWTFDSWSGDLNGSTTPATITIDGNKNVSATFTQNEYTLTTSVVGSGSITRDNAGPYHYGDVVELTAVAAIGWTFDSWSGDLNGSTTPATITIDGNKNVSAAFTQNEYTLTTSVVGSGSITRDNAGPYHYGDVVELTAVAAIGWTFDSWSGDLNGSTTPATITIDGNKNVSATFTQNEYTLTTSVVGSGSITRDNAGPYHYGDVVQLTATADLGWGFVAWSGDVSSSANPLTLTITGDMTVTANFAHILGDVDSNGIVDVTDALIILSCDVGINTSQYSSTMNCGDTNGDGKVNSTDALIVLSYDAGIAVPYPVGQPGCPAGVTLCKGCTLP